MNRMAKKIPADRDRVVPDAVEMKLLLMAIIDERFRQLYPTLKEAAQANKIDRALLSRLRNGDHSRCSFRSLFKMVEQLRIKVTIDVQFC